MKRIVALVAVAWLALFVGATPASAAAPYDTDVAALLVAPGDPAFAESTDAGAVVGPLTAASVPAMSAPFPLPAADGLRGGFARLFTADGRTVAEVGYDLGTADAAAAQAARLADSPAGEAPFEPLAIAGAAVLTARTNPASDPPYSFLAFASGVRFFVVTVTGPDAGHELLFRQAAAIGAAAMAAPGVPVTAVPVATATTVSVSRTTLAESHSFKARWNDVVQDRNTDRFLIAASILLGLVLLNRAVNAHRRRSGRVPTASPFRQSQAAWTPTAGAWPTLGTERWPGSDEPAFPTAPGQPAPSGARPALGGPTGAADVLPIDAYTGSRHAGWGDEEPMPAPAPGPALADEPLPPLPSRARTPKPTRAAPGMLAPDGADERPAAPAPAPRPGTEPADPLPEPEPSPWTLSESLGDEEHYSFPGAESWPGDAPA